MKSILFYLLIFALNISSLYSKTIPVHYSIIETTFHNIDNLYDNNLKTFAVSEELKYSEQVISINLRERIYLYAIELHWRKDSYPENYKILGSYDYLRWFVIKRNLKGSSVRILCNNKVVQFVKIYIPQESRIKSRDGKVRLSEIKIWKSENITPYIRDIKLIKITTNSAIFKWQTDYETAGQIRYGVKVDEINQIKVEPVFTTKHKLKLENLLPGKLYYYQIIALTPDNRIITSKLKKFKTKGIPYPEILSVKVIATYNSATFYINGNLKMKYTIEYKSENRKVIKRSRGYSKKAVLNIKNLRPLTEYEYKITAIDKRGFKTEYTGKFTTGEHNIALGKKVEGTFTNHYIGDIFTLKGDILKRVTDGSFSYKDGMAVSGDPAFSSQFVIIDLGRVYEIEKIITYWRALAYPYFYYLYFSKDKKEWKRYKNIINLKDKKKIYIKGVGVPLKIGETKVNLKTRYIKIFIPRNVPYYRKFPHYRFLQLMEVKVYGKYRK